MDVFCGIDWAEDHHDIALVNRDGQLLARRRISDGAAGLAALLGLPAEHGDSAGGPIPVAIETPRGLLTACLRATGRKVCPINPMAAARYRDRHSAAGRNPTTATPSSWRTSCAPTCTPTGHCPPAPN
jgi:transposase